MESRPLPVKEAGAISEKTLAIHHDKLYAGYVAKSNETRTKLEVLEKGGDVSTANQSFSELRALKDGETFAVNGVYLHEYYFDTLDGSGAPEGALKDALVAKHGSWENFVAYFGACGMAARGWVVLAWDMQAKDLRVYTGDAHNQGGVWGCVPVLVLDVYEHAYFIDFGADRKAYIQNWFTTINWAKASERFEQIQK
ncbi:superoxide dismutase [Patescibacteria group bacterium]|nr:superoxide dismutase [Patescibacteria group bacterium]